MSLLKSSYTYDLNSNITSLNRKGLLFKDGYNQSIWGYGMIDSLNYQHEGNKLLNVSDMTFNAPYYNGAFNFNDSDNEDIEYGYDANGNMVQDLNKGIVAVEYNYLNLPRAVTFNTGQVIEYIYDASGTKRSTIYKVQPEAIFAPIEGAEANIATAEHLVVQSRKDYCDSHIYNENSALTTVLLDNGYIGDGKYNFFIKDYQGNNRVVFDQSGVVEQVNHYYPYGGTFAEGLAKTQQPYKFGGKELERMNGLDWSDFGARMLDSASPSWGTIDPMAEKYYSISPYTYCAANPILYVDPNGEEIWIYFDENIKDKTVQQKVQYKDGKLYNENGSEYKGSNNYALSVLDDLNELSNDSSTLQSRIEDLQNSKNIHTIENTSKANNDNSSTSSKSKNRKGIPTGSETRYNPYNTTAPSGESRTPKTVLAHELLGHGWDSDKGKTNYKLINGIRMYEINAVNIENISRSAAGIKMRTTYGGILIPKTLLLNNSKK